MQEGTEHKRHLYWMFFHARRVQEGVEHKKTSLQMSFDMWGDSVCARTVQEIEHKCTPIVDARLYSKGAGRCWVQTDTHYRCLLAQGIKHKRTPIVDVHLCPEGAERRRAQTDTKNRCLVVLEVSGWSAGVPNTKKSVSLSSTSFEIRARFKHHMTCSHVTVELELRRVAVLRLTSISAASPGMITATQHDAYATPDEGTTMRGGMARWPIPQRGLF